MRTEEQVFEDFKKLGFEIKKYDFDYIFKNKDGEFIETCNEFKDFHCSSLIFINMQVFKLLHELFKIWRWIE